MTWQPDIDPEFAVTAEVARNLAPTTFLKWLGFKVAELGPQRVIARFAVAGQHAHADGHLHSGVLAAFADTIAGWGSLLNVPQDWRFTTLEMKLNTFRRIAVGETLWGIGTPLHIGRRTHVWEVRVMHDGARVANFVCTQAMLAPSGEPAGGDHRRPQMEIANTQPMPGDSCAESTLIEPVEVARDRVTARVSVDQRHLNTAGYVHGGVWATFADQAATWATRENLPEGAPFATAEFKINLFGAGQAGHVLEAEATPLHRGRRTHVWNVLIRRGEKLVAQGTVTQMIVQPRGGG